MADVPYVGVTRFSVAAPKGSGLKLGKLLLEDRGAYLRELYSYDRMYHRMRFLAEISAPIYQDFASRFDYRHLVQFSPEMPEPWKSQLRELADRYPVIRPVDGTGKDMVDAVRDEVSSWGRGFRGTFVWLRVDDDDVLASDYLDALSGFVDASSVGMAVNFSQTFSGLYVDGDLGDLHQVYIPNNSFGLAFICRANNNLATIESPDMVPHHHVDRYVPTILSAAEPHAFWTRHPMQDTAVGGSKLGAKLSNLQAELSKSPTADVSMILRKFPTLGSLLRNGQSSEAVSLTMGRGEWQDFPASMPAPYDAVVRVDYALIFGGQAGNGTTLSIDFEDPEAAQGHFPRDANRGDYRRLYVDAYGHGSIYLVVPKGCRIRRVRLQSDAGMTPVESASLAFTPIPKDGQA